MTVIIILIVIIIIIIVYRLSIQHTDPSPDILRPSKVYTSD